MKGLNGFMKKASIAAASLALYFNAGGCPPPSPTIPLEPQQPSQPVNPQPNNPPQTPQTRPRSYSELLEVLLNKPDSDYISDLASYTKQLYDNNPQNANQIITNELASKITSSTRMNNLVVASNRMAGLEIVFSDSGYELKLPSQNVNTPIVYYVNGITTTIPEFISQVNALRKVTSEISTPTAVTGFYNRSFSEARINDIPICPLARLSPFVSPIKTLCAGQGFLADLSEASVQTLNVWGLWQFEPGQVDKLYNSVQTAFSQNKKIIFLGHSQGNLFIQQVINRLGNRNKDDYRVVSVGTPILVSHPSGANAVSLVQIDGDILTQVIPGVPTSNTLRSIVNGTPSQDHSFEYSYLLPNSDSRMRILDDIEGFARQLTNSYPSNRWADVVVYVSDPRLNESAQSGIGQPDSRAALINQDGLETRWIEYAFTDIGAINGPGVDLRIHFEPSNGTAFVRIIQDVLIERDGRRYVSVFGGGELRFNEFTLNPNNSSKMEVDLDLSPRFIAQINNILTGVEVGATSGIVKLDSIEILNSRSVHYLRNNYPMWP